MATTHYPILFGNDPQAYRQSLAAVVGMVRQDVEVIVVAPEELDEYVRRGHVCLVVCSRLTETITAASANWILLYPDGTQQVEIHCGDEHSSRSSLDLNDLLALIDREVARSAEVAPTLERVG